MADSTLVNTFTSFANAIREKEGSTGLIPAVDMGGRIRALNVGGGFPNGTAWTQSNITSGEFMDMCYANGIWVVASANEGLYYSTNGKAWTQSNITSGYMVCVYNANGIWVAGASANKGIYYSTDGKTWTQSNVTSGDISCVYNANGIWVAVAGSRAYHSTDGKTWSSSTSCPRYAAYIQYANGLWVAASITNGLYYSIDGKTWTQSNVTSQARGLYYYDGIWASTNGRTLMLSTDGRTWTTNTIDSYVYKLHKINGLWISSGTGGLWYSTDATTWIQSNLTGGSGSIFEISSACGIIIASNHSYTYYSTDGKTWTKSNGIDAVAQCFNYNGIWVACTSNNGIYYSVTWEKPATLIEFTIETDEVVTYQAEEGMTWAEWIASDFNTGGWYDDGTGCIYDGIYLINDPVIDLTVNINDNIVANRQYTC